MKFSYLLAILALICVAESVGHFRVFSHFQADKVKATLYYEVFCPGCRSFIQNDLVEFRKHDDLMAITDLDLVPYGNAHVLTRDPPTFQMPTW